MIVYNKMTTKSLHYRHHSTRVKYVTCIFHFFCMDLTRGKKVPPVLRPRQLSAPSQLLTMLDSVEHVTLTMENYRTGGKSSPGGRTSDEAIILDQGQGISCNHALKRWGPEFSCCCTLYRIQDHNMYELTIRAKSNVMVDCIPQPTLS